MRQTENLTQAGLAERLGISASYLNLIENDRRPLSAHLLVGIARVFDLDLRTLDAGNEATLIADLNEVFGDPVFDEQRPDPAEVRELAASSPEVARAVLRLHHAYRESRSSAETLSEEVLDRQDLAGIDRTGLASEQVSEYIQRNANHFPELEEAAERIWKDGRLEKDNLHASLVRHLERRYGVTVKVLEVGDMKDAVRRYDPETRELLISESLRRGSRNFQLAHQIALLAAGDVLDRPRQDPLFTSDESRALGRVALANYLAAAVLMPYEDFHRSAEQERYDMELLGNRFRVSYEQTCHRLTTLNRKGARGVPFRMVRVDIAGNISKKFSPDGLRFPRFGGLCPLWGVHAAFLQPGRIRTQLSRLPDRTMIFSVARTVRKGRGSFAGTDVLYAIELTCDVEFAPRLVYAAGVDLTPEAPAVPVGITCRLCDRADCRARAFPSLKSPLRIDENLRGVSFFAPAPEDA